MVILTFISIEMVHGKQKSVDKSGLEIVPGKNARHIAWISPDSLVVISGKTQSFIVDTPEDEGVISTCPDADQLMSEIRSTNGTALTYRIFGVRGDEKHVEKIESGDKIQIIDSDGSQAIKHITVRRMALTGSLVVLHNELTRGAKRDLLMRFTAGQRTPDATVNLFIPVGIPVSEENILVNVIGRGKVKLDELEHQSIGRVGADFSYSKVGTVRMEKMSEGDTKLVFEYLDLRPENGADLEITFRNLIVPVVGEYRFQASYQTSQPEKMNSPGLATEQTFLFVKDEITDFTRIAKTKLGWPENPQNDAEVSFRWTPVSAKSISLESSTDSGKTWQACPAEIDSKRGTAKTSGLSENKEYAFRLNVKNGAHKGFSNVARFYAGRLDAKKQGIVADGNHDNTDAINQAIGYLHQLGGGTLLFSDGVYSVRTVQLKSNVWLYVDKSAVIKALKGLDAPESAWFSDKKYRSGLSPTDTGPYDDPENFTTKQDVGHTYFRNALFFGERLDNVKIVGNGRITGDGNLNTSDKVMNNEAGNRADKMFSFKLCTNVEVGGIIRNEDLWYDAEAGEPFYIRNNNTKDFDCGNMLHIDRGGHFVLLATGTDSIQIHDVYQGRNSSSNVRDIFDFMGCNEVTVNNIYCRLSSDDIVKLGSDCSLGFTRPAKNYKIRNIIGDTNCNLFQIGSETADDITDVAVDNIYVLGANKAGFSISSNDGGHIRNVWLNSGQTGPVHFRSKMCRTTTPFFISISHRGRILGSHVSRYKFTENGVYHDELLCTNLNIGEVENIHLNEVDCEEVYSGSSFRSDRWRAYNGSQRKATPIVAGYKLPESGVVEGGLNFRLPNGKHTGYITNITFNDVHVLVKGGNPLADAAKIPPEMGVGQYNVSNLGIQPAYGLWVRHAQGLTVKNCSFNYEKEDGRYAIFLDDVQGATIDSVKMVKAQQNAQVVKLFGSHGVSILNSVFYRSEWGKSPVLLPRIKKLKGDGGFPL